ncbi:nucleoprotein [Vaprio virus]|uniref:Nucleoprotein n=1 Tax=Vaprio virus TaxID=2100727 RepID=A0A2P1BSY6_9RHAB|nr:nucleoprotein [Vaprio virus]AVI57363.1 nucleoprotein [Vaprio virus]
MANQTVYRFSTKKIIAPKLPLESSDARYPADFFQKGEMPILVIHYKKEDLPKMRFHVRRGLEDNVLDIKIVNAFLFYVMVEKEPFKIHSEWKSFDIKIAGAGDERHHFCMYQVEIKNEDFPNKDAKDETDESKDKALVFSLLFQYRANRATYDAYKTELCSKATKTVQMIDPNATPLSKTLAGATAAWTSNPNFTKIVAGIDMYFFKNKEAEWADLRFCTLGSRYKDCAALTALSYITQLTSIKIHELLLWIFTERMADEADRLSQEGNEVDQADSYMPYMRDMGISDKSPYSAQMNPALTTFCHVVGCLLDSTRSKNSRLAGEVDRLNSVVNGVVVAYVLSSRPTFVQVYGADASAQQQSIQPNMVMGKMPATPDPDEWFLYLGKSGFVLPQEIKNWFERKAKALTETRSGTIGEHLQNKRTI